MNKQQKKNMLMALSAFQVVSTNVKANDHDSITNSAFSCKLKNLKREKFLSQNEFPGNYVSKYLSSSSSNIEMFQSLGEHDHTTNYYETEYPHKLPNLFEENTCVEVSPLMNGYFGNSLYKCDIKKLKREIFLSLNEFPGYHVGGALNSSYSNTDMLNALIENKQVGDYYIGEFPHKLPNLFEDDSCQSKSAVYHGYYTNSEYECSLKDLNREKFLNPNNFPGNYVSGELDNTSSNAELMASLSNDPVTEDYFSVDYPHKLPMLFNSGACSPK